MNIDDKKKGTKPKFTIETALGAMSLMILYVSLRFIIALYMTDTILESESFMSFAIDNIDSSSTALANTLSMVINIASLVLSLFVCAFVAKAFIALDKKFFSKAKYGSALKLLIFFSPLLFSYFVRSDIAKWKDTMQDRVAVIAKDFIVNNPEYFVKGLGAKYDFIGYLVFDEEKEPHLILKKLKQGRNKINFSTDFLSMKLSLDLDIVGEEFCLSNLDISGKINHSEANLLPMKAEQLSPITGSKILAKSVCSSLNKDSSAVVDYKTYLFIYKTEL